MTLGDAADVVLNAVWKIPFAGGPVAKLLTHLILDQRFNQARTIGRRGPHHILTSGWPVESDSKEFRSDSIELVFDATNEAYVDFLDTILVSSASFRQAGYISVRPSRSSRATLSMHNIGTSHAVSIECATMKGLPDNRSWMEYLQREGLQRNGRPHWGQVNKLDDIQVLTLYGANLIRWREALLRVSQESTLFSNNFTRQRGLEPVEIPREVTAVKKTPRGVVTHLCGAAGSTWSSVTVADAMRQIDQGVARYHTRAGAQIANIEVVHAADGTPEYLRTAPDSAPENNLDNLPRCMS